MELELPLIRAAAAGDTEAFTRIVAAYHRDMARVAFTIVGDVSGSEDAVQSAWAIAWRQLGSHREDASLRSWLLKITANEARQVVRGAQRRSVREIAVDDDDSGRSGLPGATDRTELIPARLDLGRALARLSVDDRTLIALRYGADLDSNELARLLGGTPGSVRVRLHRLLVRLREDLNHG